jgi:hypothetical protein
MAEANFVTNALPLAALNLRVIPVEPHDKACKLPNWQNLATTDPKVIESWGRIYPEHNLGIVAKGRIGELCILEFDVKGGMKEAADEMGVPIPKTRVHRSGKGFGHWLFWHTEDSVALGNRQANRDGHEWFSFRADDRYVVAPPSIHPNGNRYSVVNDSPIIPMPSWVVEWIKKHTAQTVKQSRGAVQVHDDFDLDAFLDHYSISILGVKDQVWHIVDVCPGVGHRHENSTLTGFYYDGSSLGWSCFAQGCPLGGRSIGEVIKFLNQTHDPYRGVIWSKESELELLKQMGVDTLDDSEPMPESDCDTAIESDSDPEPEQEEQPPNKARDVRQIAGTCMVDDDEFQLVTVNAADYDMTVLKWLWPDRIPAGKLSLLTGKPDCGKTLALLDLVARVSTGKNWPDGSVNRMGERRVLVAASEDDPADTLIPRLAAAGANLKNVDIIWGTVFRESDGQGNFKKGRKTALNLKRDALALLRAVEARPDIALLALDPISSFFGEADQNRDKDIRPIMDMIAKLCQRCGITVVGLIHSNKRSDVDAVQKVLGASALAGSARAVWGFSRDTEDKTKFHMALVKGNLAKKRTGLNYSIGETLIEIEGEVTTVPHIIWGDELDADANDLLAEERQKQKDGGGDRKIDMASALITANLPALARDMYRKAEAEGITEKTLQRAKARLGVVSKELNDGWHWYMPGTEPKFEAEEAKLEDEQVM